MGREAPTTLIDGDPGDRIPVDDRGLLYGDGLFETLRVMEGEVPLWPRHWRRLQRGAEMLDLALPDEAAVQGEIARVAAGESVVVRLTLTRGSGAGYAPPREARVRRVVSRVGPLPARHSAGLELIVCETRLGRQPVLAGLKHLGRLEQVLAAAEVARTGCDDGLMLDGEGRVIESTRCNLIARRDGEWITPDLSDAGVAGVYREFLLDSGAVRVQPLHLNELAGCEALCLCNAVRGLCPVAAVGDVIRYSPEAGRSALKALPRPW